MELKCKVQNYSWGKLGIDSIVATLVKGANYDIVLDEVTPYAELWMGTHPNGPSYLKDEDKSLEDYIKENKEILGLAVEEQFGVQLPFLFKILSVNKALSIQAHPSKEHAEKLHREHPDIYKDPNHKPELTIALTPFEALCGFRPIAEIKEYLETIPELSAVVGVDNVLALMSTNDTRSCGAALKKCFHSLLTCDPEIAELQLKKLLDRLTVLDNADREFLNADLLEQLHSEYPGDVGCFGLYLFNCVTLQPGEAMYLEPNEPHAYLSDCVECMSCSDNVVRAGLTPKLKDITTLVEMLTYTCKPGNLQKFQSTREDEFTELFRPPVPEFAVAKITIPPGRAFYDLIPRSTGSILILVNGKIEIFSSKVLKTGSVIFIAANEKMNIKVLCGCHPIQMFQAFVNV